MNKIRCKAEVRWFNKITGKGYVKLTTGEHKGLPLPIYACNIKGKKTWYPETACVYYEPGQKITVDVKWDSHATFVIGITKGILDKDRWDSMDQNKLAFKCNAKGEATNGLF